MLEYVREHLHIVFLSPIVAVAILSIGHWVVWGGQAAYRFAFVRKEV